MTPAELNVKGFENKSLLYAQCSIDISQICLFLCKIFEEQEISINMKTVYQNTTCHISKSIFILPLVFYVLWILEE